MERRSFIYGTVNTLTHLTLLACRSRTPSPHLAHQARRTVFEGKLEIPEGFNATRIHKFGDRFSDGSCMGPQPDGMTCGVLNNSWVLLRNHELNHQTPFKGFDSQWFNSKAVKDKSYAPGFYGGVSRAVLDPSILQRELSKGIEESKAVKQANAVLVGTDRNCAGGHLQLDGVDYWVSCEETYRDKHGYAFWTRVDDQGVVDARSRRLLSWGRFQREAIAVDPNTRIAYMTEDHPLGLFYRHLPKDKSNPLGPGQLQALRVDNLLHTDPQISKDAKLDCDGCLIDRATAALSEGYETAVKWVDIPDPSASKVFCREQGAALGATMFNRGEGIVYDPKQGHVYLVASTAGPLCAGQIFRYSPSSNTLSLFSQVTDRQKLSMPDNVTMAPWGDLILAEDNYNSEGITHQHVRGMRMDGSVYDIVRNLNNASIDTCLPGGEFAGVCFSPEGEVLFVNIQSPENVTVAIHGPWAKLRG